MPSVRLRISAGIGAWMVGATSATVLSLVAVSHLGTGSHGSQGPTLSADQVKQALAAMTGTAESPADPEPAATQPTPSPRSATATATRQSASMGAPTSPSSGESPAEPPVERRLSVDGGAVVAQCQESMVYLSSWSPAQGYQVESVQRGPASSATVMFVGNAKRVTVNVACSDGVPSLTAGDEGDAPEQ